MIISIWFSCASVSLAILERTRFFRTVRLVLGLPGGLRGWPSVGVGRLGKFGKFGKFGRVDMWFIKLYNN